MQGPDGARTCKPLDAGAADSMRGGPSFTLRNRMLRVLWRLTWLVLARWTPPPMHRWRAGLLRMFGARLGPRCRIHAGVEIWWPGNLDLGANVLIGPGAILYNQGHIAIGSDTVVSQRAHICASTHDTGDADFQLVLKPVTLGERCWVAAEAFVGPGVGMGDGAVLAARGALFQNAEPWTIYRGNPAEAVRKREQPAGAA